MSLKTRIDISCQFPFGINHHPFIDKKRARESEREREKLLLVGRTLPKQCVQLGPSASAAPFPPPTAFNWREIIRVALLLLLLSRNLAFYNQCFHFRARLGCNMVQFSCDIRITMENACWYDNAHENTIGAQSATIDNETERCVRKDSW